jgi:hypothetical protein
VAVRVTGDAERFDWRGVGEIADCYKAAIYTHYALTVESRRHYRSGALRAANTKPANCVASLRLWHSTTSLRRRNCFPRSYLILLP